MLGPCVILPVGDPTSPPASFSWVGKEPRQTHWLAKGIHSLAGSIADPELGTSNRVLAPRPHGLFTSPTSQKKLFIKKNSALEDPEHFKFQRLH